MQFQTRLLIVPPILLAFKLHEYAHACKLHHADEIMKTIRRIIMTEAIVMIHGMWGGAWC
jgi:hypothetical protein